MTFPDRSWDPSVLIVESECLQDLRTSLSRTYPTVSIGELFRILRKHSLTRFPAGFLLSQGSGARSVRHVRAAIRTANRHGQGVSNGWHPLWSTEYYRLVNADVRASGVSPWLHYQVFGRHEGRSPHPLIETEFLSAAMMGVPIGNVIDEYVSNPGNWAIEPGPYVDVQRFIVSGAWDSTTHPLVDIVERYLDSPWVHRRLMLVDTASPSQSRSRLTGVGFLIAAGTARSDASTIDTWDNPADTRSVETSGHFTTVPGYFLGVQGHALYSGHDVVSPDGTVVRLSDGLISVRSGTTRAVAQLVFLTGWATREWLRELITTAPSGTTIAPFTESQETAMRQLRRDVGRRDLEVLPFGEQTQLVAESYRIESADAGSAATLWKYGTEVDPNSVSIVLPERQRRRATGDKQVRRLLEEGAALCLVGTVGLNPWLPIIQSRKRLLVDRALLGDVRAFVDDGTVAELPRSPIGLLS